MNKMKECRAKLGLTQQDLAEKLGVDRVSIANWEAESNMPSQSSMEKIAELFSCCVIDIFPESAARFVTYKPKDAEDMRKFVSSLADGWGVSL